MFIIVIFDFDFENVKTAKAMAVKTEIELGPSRTPRIVLKLNCEMPSTIAYKF